MTTKLLIQLLLAWLLIALLSSCSSDTPPNRTSSDGTTMDITDALLSNRSADCSEYVGSYDSSVTDIKRGLSFTGDISLTATSTTCTITSNDIPNHNFNDVKADFATEVAEVDKSFSFPINPTMANTTTELDMGVVNVILLNGVVVDILPAACYGINIKPTGSEDLGSENLGCGSDQIDNPWRYDPMSSLNAFGTDSHNAHVQPDGSYHYHGNPVALFTQDCSTATSESPVIGFAADGFPVYGSCIEDDNGDIVEVKSSWKLKNNGGTRVTVSPYITPAVGNGDIASNHYDGQFRGDYEYAANHGDLDECNGRRVDGQYGYYVTKQFPWIVNCYKGTVQPSFKPSSPKALELKLHGHQHIPHNHD